MAWWLHSGLISGYYLIRQDRNRHGGGVAIYILDTFLFSVAAIGPNSLELISISINHPSTKIGLAVLYRPPPVRFLTACSAPLKLWIFQCTPITYCLVTSTLTFLQTILFVPSCVQLLISFHSQSFPRDILVWPTVLRLLLMLHSQPILFAPITALLFLLWDQVTTSVYKFVRSKT